MQPPYVEYFHGTIPTEVREGETFSPDAEQKQWTGTRARTEGMIKNKNPEEAKRTEWSRLISSALISKSKGYGVC